METKILMHTYLPNILLENVEKNFMAMLFCFIELL